MIELNTIYNITSVVTTRYCNMGNCKKNVDEIKCCYDEFFDKVMFNLCHDIREIESKNATYMKGAFLEEKDNVEKYYKDGAYCLKEDNINAELSINDEKYNTFKKQVESAIYSLEILTETMNLLGMYEYLQSKLDWFTIVPENISKSLIDIIDKSNYLNYIRKFGEFIDEEEITNSVFDSSGENAYERKELNYI